MKNVHFVGLKNYVSIFTSGAFWEYFTNTLVFTFTSVSFQMIIGMLGALLMQNAIRGVGIIRTTILIPWAIPGIIVAQMFKFFLDDQYGMVNEVLRRIGMLSGQWAWLSKPGYAMGAIVLADSWKQFPFVAIMLLAALQTVPKELYEAAEVDGANAIKRFTRITLPNIKPVLLVVLLFRTMNALRIFDIIYAMTGGGPANSTMTLLFSSYRRLFGDMNIGIGSAMATIVLLITLIFSAIYIYTLKDED